MEPLQDPLKGSYNDLPSQPDGWTWQVNVLCFFCAWLAVFAYLEGRRLDKLENRHDYLRNVVELRKYEEPRPRNLSELNAKMLRAHAKDPREEEEAHEVWSFEVRFVKTPSTEGDESR